LKNVQQKVKNINSLRVTIYDALPTSYKLRVTSHDL